ncbi:MAG: hypothetical protein J3K34DRAFT_504758 [Monoraphidium minutum]|nr:MAG: hypothetical protein J3K34DRAFT_504758 [Monoraphidium minutum]
MDQGARRAAAPAGPGSAPLPEDALLRVIALAPRAAQRAARGASRQLRRLVDASRREITICSLGDGAGLMRHVTACCARYPEVQALTIVGLGHGRGAALVPLLVALAEHCPHLHSVHASLDGPAEAALLTGCLATHSAMGRLRGLAALTLDVGGELGASDDGFHLQPLQHLAGLTMLELTCPVEGRGWMPRGLRHLRLGGVPGPEWLGELPVCGGLRVLQLVGLSWADLGVNPIRGDDKTRLCAAVGQLTALEELSGILALSPDDSLPAAALLRGLTQLRRLALYNDDGAGGHLRPAVRGALRDLAPAAASLEVLALWCGATPAAGGPALPNVERLHLCADGAAHLPASLAGAFPAAADVTIGASGHHVVSSALPVEAAAALPRLERLTLIGCEDGRERLVGAAGALGGAPALRRLRVYGVREAARLVEAALRAPRLACAQVLCCGDVGPMEQSALARAAAAAGVELVVEAAVADAGGAGSRRWWRERWRELMIEGAVDFAALPA